jgi:hypothetical protein
MSISCSDFRGGFINEDSGDKPEDESSPAGSEIEKKLSTRT